MLFVCAAIVDAQNPPSAPPQRPQAQQPPPASQALPVPSAPQNPPVTPSAPTGTVVIDPGHGGADAGARGSGGVLEKDVVMSLAQLLRSTLERQGFRVVMTRHANENPSYDDRAATANAYRGALLVALHVSSTGAPGIARAYFSVPPPAEPPADSQGQAQARPENRFENRNEKQEPLPPRPVGLVRWEEAQPPHIAASKRMADAVQGQIKQRMDKSPAEAASASLRDLRSIAGPAIAVELASVSVKDRKAIDPFLQPLAEAIAHGIRAYHGTGAAAGGS